MAGDGPLPPSLVKVAAAIRSAGGPAAWVVSVVLTALVGAWLSGVRFVAGSILSVGDILADGEALVRSSLAGIFGPVGGLVVGAIVGLQNLLASLVTPLGPLAPAAVVFVWGSITAATAWVGYALFRRFVI